MKIDDLETELNESGWAHKPEDIAPFTTNELLAEKEQTSQKMDANLKRRIKRRGESVEHVLSVAGRTSQNRPALCTTTTLIMLSMIGMMGGPLEMH
jgi:hypothetical protein